MKKNAFILFSLGALLVTACAKKETQTAPEVQTDETTLDITEEETTDKIALNNGEKWMVNEEMKPHVTATEDLFNTYVSSNGTDYNKLATDMKTNIDQLIKSCTMQGQSHDELHKWLHPFMEQVAELKEAKTKEEAAEVLTDIKTSFEVYHEYFN